MTRPAGEPQFLTKVDVVAEWLRNEIVNGRLKLGLTLKQNHIAQRLGTSATPVREAFVVLESEGLVERRPNRGVVVADRHYGDIADLFEILSALEAVAMRRVGAAPSEETIEELARALADERAALAIPDAHAYRRASEAFHQAFVRGADSKALTEFVGLAAPRARFNNPFEVKRANISMREHARILAALRAGDQAELGELVRSHMVDRVGHLRSAVGRRENR